MKFTFFFAVLATVSSLVAPVVSAPIPQAHAVEKRASTGKGTYYDVGLGACGKRNTNSQPIIAVNHAQFNKKLCGKWVTVKNTKNGKSTRGYIEDMCPGCGWGSLDLSPSVFKKLAALSVGVINVSWGTPTSKRSEDGSNFVIRAGTPENDPDFDAEYDDPDYKFDDAEALSEEDLAELLNAPNPEATPAPSDVAGSAASLTS